MLQILGRKLYYMLIMHFLCLYPAAPEFDSLGLITLVLRLWFSGVFCSPALSKCHVFFFFGWPIKTVPIVIL